jgi:hypothetical protein
VPLWLSGRVGQAREARWAKAREWLKRAVLPEGDDRPLPGSSLPRSVAVSPPPPPALLLPLPVFLLYTHSLPP